FMQYCMNERPNLYLQITTHYLRSYVYYVKNFSKNFYPLATRTCVTSRYGPTGISDAKPCITLIVWPKQSGMGL
ncbi:hypothetical protein P4V58_29120, partial [Bacillus wiedmannii]|uniref:hypothetical protein n=1 Tax=Bacillus wiedmannii TaxID=1890302 RepID=UPI002E23769E|nr:hypothetical protein [Bacillus wiedmannii]